MTLLPESNRIGPRLRPISTTLHRPRRPETSAGKISAASNDALQLAMARGRGARLPYAGAVTPIEAHRLLLERAAVIVDVRTRPEWEFVGRIEGVPLIEWRCYGAAAPDARFIDHLAQHFSRDAALLLLCRSGVRSHHAAIAAAGAGFTRVFNILGGFEGDPDTRGRRSTTGGWRHAGLPWTQG